MSLFLDLTLVITDRNILGYLAQFPDEEQQYEKALEALKVGVIAIESASPTLDTGVVQSKFSEIEGRMQGQLADFQKSVTDDLFRYFAERDGVLPRSIDSLATWSERIADMATKARTIQNSGKVIEQCANDLKQDLDSRVTAIPTALRPASAS